MARIEELEDPLSVIAADVTLDVELSASDLTLLARVVAKIESTAPWN